MELGSVIGELYGRFRKGEKELKEQIIEKGKQLMQHKKNNKIPDPEFKALFQGNGRVYGKCIAGLKGVGLVVKKKVFFLFGPRTFFFSVPMFVTASCWPFGARRMTSSAF